MKEINQYYELSHPQKRILYTEKFFPGTCMENNAFTVRLEGRIN
ncbi:MAG: hypothetical protein N2645_05455 [Clostridia bacterium]|nr:hypothetical protein [Clostridia bacterium]